MKPVPMIKPKYIFLSGWIFTSIFILLNCHYGWNGTNTSEVFYFNEESDEDLRKIILLVTFMRSGSSFIGEFFNLHPGKNNFNSISFKLTKDIGISNLETKYVGDTNIKKCHHPTDVVINL